MPHPLLAEVIPIDAAGNFHNPDNAVKNAISALNATRGSADPRIYQRAEQQLAQLVATQPGQPKTQALQAWLMMSRHRFVEALVLCERALAQDAVEPLALALRADALTELGRYDDALVAVQMLLDHSAPLTAYPRAAQLRFLHGDISGALTLAQQALNMTAPKHAEHEWLTRDLVRFMLHAGQLEAAKNTLRTLPMDSAENNALLARVLLASGDTQGARRHWKMAYQLVPMPEYGVALWKLAQTTQAPEEVRELRRLTRMLNGQAQLDAAQGGLATRNFIEFFVRSNRLADLAKAEHLARAEWSRRPDIYSEAQLAWVLSHLGKTAEALEHAQLARRLNTQDNDLIEWLADLPVPATPPHPSTHCTQCKAAAQS